MSLLLHDRSDARPIPVHIVPTVTPTVLVGEYELTIDDVLRLAHYALTNTDLVQGDSRLQFIESVKSMIEAPGFHEGGTRLKNIIPLVLQG